MITHPPPRILVSLNNANNGNVSAFVIILDTHCRNQHSRCTRPFPVCPGRFASVGVYIANWFCTNRSCFKRCLCFRYIIKPCPVELYLIMPLLELIRCSPDVYVLKQFEASYMLMEPYIYIILKHQTHASMTDRH